MSTIIISIATIVIIYVGLMVVMIMKGKKNKKDDG